MAFPNDFSYNFCPNPSFVLGIAGVTAVAGAGISQMTRLGFSAQTSLQVQTPGNATGEGVSLPPGVSLDTVTGAISFQVQGGPVTLNVSAVDTTTSTVLGTTTYTVDSTLPWQQVSITGLSFVNGDTISVFVETASPTVSTFWIGGIQYEPATTANAGVLPTPYVDGNQAQGIWVGSPNASASYKPYAFMLAGNGMIHAAGVSQFLSSGQAVFLVNLDPALGPTVATGGVDASGVPFAGIETNTPGVPGGVPFLTEGFGLVTLTAFTVITLPSGMTDFAAFKVTDIDPAIIRIGASNSGTNMGNNSNGWQRIYGKYSVPKHQAGNNGTYIWNDGVYTATGYQFGTIVAGSAVNLALAQIEAAQHGVETPSPYQRPRSLIPVIGPTTFNYCPNPTFENNTTSWSPIVSTSPSVSSSISLDGAHVYLTETNSLLVSGTTANFGAVFTATSLVVGQTYTLSTYVWPNAAAMSNGQLHDIQVVVNPANFTGSLTSDAIGSSLSLLVPANIPLNSYDVNGNPAWYRPVVSFTATESNMTLGLWAVPVTGFSGTMTFNIDQVMLNLGDNAVPYADGNSDGWAWEQGVTPGNGRSYFYDRAVITSQYIEGILTQNVPLGQYSYQPEYFTPVQQYTS